MINFRFLRSRQDFRFPDATFRNQPAHVSRGTTPATMRRHLGNRRGGLIVCLGLRREVVLMSWAVEWL